jgi:hypothetical protein
MVESPDLERQYVMTKDDYRIFFIHERSKWQGDILDTFLCLMPTTSRPFNLKDHEKKMPEIHLPHAKSFMGFTVAP